jgi:hypothetical protein
MTHRLSDRLLTALPSIPLDLNGRPITCPHSSGKTLRWKTQSNLARVLTYQCLICGRGLDAVRKATIPESRWKAIPEWDKELERRYQEASSQAWNRYNANWKERADAEAAAERQSRRDAYAEYLRSAEWQYRRSLRLSLDAHQCQARLTYCTGRATEVHHLTYQHIGNEPLFDLASVCSSCHRQISEREGRLTNGGAS